MYSRMLRVNELMRREVSAFMERNMELPPDTLATIVRTEVAPDFTSANVFISVYPVNQRGTVMQMFERHRRDLMSVLAKKTRWRKLPSVHFTVDNQEEKADKVLRVLDDLEQKG